MVGSCCVACAHPRRTIWVARSWHPVQRREQFGSALTATYHWTRRSTAGTSSNVPRTAGGCRTDRGWTRLPNHATLFLARMLQFINTRGWSQSREAVNAAGRQASPLWG